MKIVINSIFRCPKLSDESIEVINDINQRKAIWKISKEIQKNNSNNDIKSVEVRKMFK